MPPNRIKYDGGVIIICSIAAAKDSIASISTLISVPGVVNGENLNNRLK